MASSHLESSKVMAVKRASRRKSYKIAEKDASLDWKSYPPQPVVHQLRGSILRKIRSGQEVLPEIDGREETKADVLRAILSGAHIYLVSEEGTGKTRLARSLTRLLPRIPVIRGCPYNDDPHWHPSHLCPRCRQSKNPAKEFGVEFLPGSRRFSRIQGNEYTNESKLLGLKDIQAIAHGLSPTDPSVFTGTGVFKANRGILFVDELPAIRTKVQVLFHPILEEKKAILEEYNWEHPLDLFLIATGNPRGFSHVNEVPRPLLDRLETVYMDLPEEEVEKEIMLKERFATGRGLLLEEEEAILPPSREDIERKVIAPWWIIEAVNKTVRFSRICPTIDKKPSIRATNKAIDHTYASAELENVPVASLRHAYYGLRLALRGRIGLRAEQIDFDNPKKTFKLGEQLAEDFLWNALEDLAMGDSVLESDGGKLAAELEGLLSSVKAPFQITGEALRCYEALWQAVERMSRMWSQKLKTPLLTERERSFYTHLPGEDSSHYYYSAVEILANLALHKSLVEESSLRGLFVPRRYVSKDAA